MADEQQPLELFRFADSVQSVSLRVLPDKVRVAFGREYREASLVVASDFVSGQVTVMVSDEEVDEWERCLEALEREDGITWPENDRSAWIQVIPDDPVEVTVSDSPSSQVAVEVPIEVDEHWLEANRARLAEVRRYLAGRPPSQPARDLA
ncbi:DUF5959 family protein [Streptomyces millisiae]|uniref:DUF5959 family protein n=1 Tax=Streptomyces millisiae TaxID=3075542 RepID=A0ABU2LQ48_9ACTN|nr:DUF5959 family protein [Streptomyces sp. DSM 44918]MDT0319712.1 DUF5959 family protein [Streptomyces sp. DSM 44918]